VRDALMMFTLTREQLYDVWSEPMQRLIEQTGISDVAIATRAAASSVSSAIRNGPLVATRN